jgi:hypothetical protein
MPSEDLAHRLAGVFAASDLRWDTNGTVTLTVEAQSIRLHPSDGGDGVCLEAELDTWVGLPTEILLPLMAANRWPRESMAGVLAIDSGERICLTHWVRDGSLSAAHAESLIRRFAHHASAWKAYLAALRAPPARTYALEALA